MRSIVENRLCLTRDGLPAGVMFVGPRIRNWIRHSNWRNSRPGDWAEEVAVECRERHLVENKRTFYIYFNIISIYLLINDNIFLFFFYLRLRIILTKT